MNILYESWLLGVFRIYTTLKLPMTSILGSYIRGIHHVTMIYILHICHSQFSTPDFRQQEGQSGAGQCSPAALYGHKMPPPCCALRRTQHPSCVSIYSLCLAMAILVTSLRCMAHTPYGGASGEASPQVLERLPCAT